MASRDKKITNKIKKLEKQITTLEKQAYKTMDPKLKGEMHKIEQEIQEHYDALKEKAASN